MAAVISEKLCHLENNCRKGLADAISQRVADAADRAGDGNVGQRRFQNIAASTREGGVACVPGVGDRGQAAT